MAIEGATVSSKEHQATPCVKDISVLPSPTAGISNEMNGFYDFCRKFRPFILCNDYAKPAAFSAMLVPNEKASAKCIRCISYTGVGNDSGKLPGMTELNWRKYQLRVWHTFAGSPADKLAKRRMKKFTIVPKTNKAF